MMEVIWFLLPLLAMALIGLGLWWVGQVLRRKGYGEQLNRLDEKLTTAKQKSNHLLRPLGGAMLGLSRELSKAPLLGSRRQRDSWEKLEALSKEQNPDI